VTISAVSRAMKRKQNLNKITRDLQKRLGLCCISGCRSLLQSFNIFFFVADSSIFAVQFQFYSSCGKDINIFGFS